LKAAGRQVRWLVMGYPGAECWQRAAADAGVQGDVIFTGRVPYANAPRMLALGDIAIAPKLSLTEGSGKILNYMAMGLPTVAFDTPAQREYLGSLGVYAPVGDSAALAQGVADLLDRPALRRALGERLRRVAVQQFGWDRAAATLLTVYRQLLSHTQPTPAQRPQRQDKRVL
jgi:Glycosyltransferase